VFYLLGYSASRWFLAWLILRGDVFLRNVSTRTTLYYNPEVRNFITTAVRTSNPTRLMLFMSAVLQYCQRHLEMCDGMPAFITDL
jgi:hypothetical protein